MRRTIVFEERPASGQLDLDTMIQVSASAAQPHLSLLTIRAPYIPLSSAPSPSPSPLAFPGPRYPVGLPSTLPRHKTNQPRSRWRWTSPGYLARYTIPSMWCPATFQPETPSSLYGLASRHSGQREPKQNANGS